MFDFQQMYREKLRTPEAAVECVKDGDWVDYTSSLGKPVLLDRALAKRRDELHDVKIRGNLMAAMTVRSILCIIAGTVRSTRESCAMRANAIIYRWCSTTMRLIMSISSM